MIKKALKKCTLVLALALVFPFVNKVHANPPEVIINFMTRNRCFTENHLMEPQGIMVHSTAVPGVMAQRWFELWNKTMDEGQTVGVHAFLDDKCICQYLPWEVTGHHCGDPGNQTHIGFEICEPAGIKYDKNQQHILEGSYNPNDPYYKEYFENIWQNAVWLCANLCQQFKINPSQIVSHQEGYLLGIASNHGDPKHWWDFHGKDMGQFRAAVFCELMKRGKLITF